MNKIDSQPFFIVQREPKIRYTEKKLIYNLTVASIHKRHPAIRLMKMFLSGNISECSMLFRPFIQILVQQRIQDKCPPAARSCWVDSSCLWQWCRFFQKGTFTAAITKSVSHLAASFNFRSKNNWNHPPQRLSTELYSLGGFVRKT